MATVRLGLGMSGVLVQEPLPASPKCHWYSRSWKGRVVASAVVPVASKNTAKGATPEMRLAASEAWMASVGVTGVHAGTEPEAGGVMGKGAPPSSGTAATIALEAIATPVINQTAMLPSLKPRHRMSDLPSPLKSPTPAMNQSAGTLLTTLVPERAMPFMNQIATVPSAARHRMSDLPSPLKSPMPAMSQLNGTPVNTKSEAILVASFISHTATEPSGPRHSRSALPSPSKSPLPARYQGCSASSSSALPVRAAPFRYHRAFDPSALRHTISDLQSPLKSCCSRRFAFGF